MAVSHILAVDEGSTRLTPPGFDGRFSWLGDRRAFMARNVKIWSTSAGHWLMEPMPLGIDEPWRLVQVSQEVRFVAHRGRLDLRVGGDVDRIERGAADWFSSASQSALDARRPMRLGPTELRWPLEGGLLVCLGLDERHLAALERPALAGVLAPASPRAPRQRL